MAKVYTCVITNPAIDKVKVYRYNPFKLPSLKALCSGKIRYVQRRLPKDVIQLPLIRAILIRGVEELNNMPDKNLFEGVDILQDTLQDTLQQPRVSFHRFWPRYLDYPYTDTVLPPNGVRRFAVGISPRGKTFEDFSYFKKALE